MYATLLTLHSLLRWAVLLAALWAALTAAGGLGARRVWTRRARIPGVVLAAAIDLQFLLGFVLWLAVSPYAVTGSGALYWTALHPVGGLAVLALVHIGSVRVKRALDDRGRWRAAAWFYGAALAIALVTVPWPVAGFGRSLLPF